MNSPIKIHIAAALAILVELHQVGHIREEGNTKFQSAKAELEGALDTPDEAPAPAPVIVPAGVIEAIDDRLLELQQGMTAQVDAINTYNATVLAAIPPAPAASATPAL